MQSQIIPPIDGSIQRETDLLTESQSRNQELPMSLAWYRRARLKGNSGPPFVRVGGRIFYRRGELRLWIAAQNVPSGSAQAPEAR
jgi:hypothetical protein